MWVLVGVVGGLLLIIGYLAARGASRPPMGRPPSSDDAGDREPRDPRPLVRAGAAEEPLPERDDSEDRFD